MARFTNLPRLVDPRHGHERIMQRSSGVKSGRELSDEIGSAYDMTRSGSTKRQRIRGSLTDGEAFRNLGEAGEREGLWIFEDEIEPDDLPPIYENNSVIHTRGAAPGIAAGGSTVVGTGGTVALADATDMSGRIFLTTGTGVSAAGTIATITFAVPHQNADYAVLLTAADADAASTAGQSVYCDFNTRATTTWVLSCAATLASSTSYHWDYLIVDRSSL